MQDSGVVTLGPSSCGSQDLEQRLNSGDTRASLLHSMWIKHGIKPMFPALAGGFFTIEPPGKPSVFF